MRRAVGRPQLHLPRPTRTPLACLVLALVVNFAAAAAGDEGPPRADGTEAGAALPGLRLRLSLELRGGYPSPGAEAPLLAAAGKPPQPPNTGGSLGTGWPDSPQYWGAGGAGPASTAVLGAWGNLGSSNLGKAPLRLHLSLGGASGLDASWLRLTGSDPRRAAERLSFSVSGKRLSLSALHQQIGDRLDSDRALSAEDRTLLGSSWGTRRQSLSAGYALGSAGSLAGTLTRLQAAEGGFQHQRLGWTRPDGSHLSFDLGRMDAGFQRLGDLPEADRSGADQRRGQRWRDLSAGLRITRWLSTDGLWSHSQTLADRSERGRSRQQWIVTPAKGATLTWLRDVSSLWQGKQTSDTSLNSLRFEQKLPSLSFSWLRDETTTRTGKQSTRTVAQSLKLEKKLPALSIAGALDTLGAAGSGDTRRLNLRVAGPAGRPTTGSLDLTALQGPRDRREQTAKLELTTRLPFLKALKLEEFRRSADGQGEERLAGEAQGPISGRLQWRATLARVRTERAPGRRDLTVVLSPPVPPARPSQPRLSLWLARSEPLAPLTGTGPHSGDWKEPTQAALLMREQTVGTLPLSAGLFQMATRGDSRYGLAYDLRTDPKRPLQMELSRRLTEAGKAASPLLAREALALRPAAGWHLSLARERLTAMASSGLEDAEARWLFEIGRRTRRFQWSVAGGHQMAPDGRRRGLATRWHVEGPVAPGANLRLDYEDYPALPGPDRLHERLVLAYQQRLDPNLRVDLQGTWQRRFAPAKTDLTWRLDLKALF